MSFSERRRSALRILICVLTVLCILFTGGCGKSTEGKTPESQPVEDRHETSSPTDTKAEPKVETAVDYSKPVVDMLDPSKNFDWTQRVCLPRLVWDSENAEKFNRKIIDSYSEILDVLKTDNEEDALCEVTYQYSINGGIVAIAINSVSGWQYSNLYNDYDGFYFDTTLDREMTNDEYIRAMGGVPEQLFDEAIARLYAQIPYDITCEAGNTALYDGEFLIEVNCVFVDSMGESAELVEVGGAGSAQPGLPGGGTEAGAAKEVTTAQGHKFYVPEGFEEEDRSITYGNQYPYYNPDLNMWITVFESTVAERGFDTGEEWIDSDYLTDVNYSYCTYTEKKANYYVTSGEYDTEDKFYTRKQFIGTNAIEYTLIVEWLSSSQPGRDEKCQEIIDQFEDSFQYNGSTEYTGTHGDGYALNVDKDKVAQIKEWYYDFQDRKSEAVTAETDEGDAHLKGYWLDGKLLSIDRSCNGTKESFYYDPNDGNLYFAFLRNESNGENQKRVYIWEGTLVQWIDPEGTVRQDDPEKLLKYCCQINYSLPYSFE